MKAIRERTAGMDRECSRCGQLTRSPGHKVCLWCEVEALRDLLARLYALHPTTAGDLGASIRAALEES